MTFGPDFLLQLVLAVGSAVGVYAGIKSDLTAALIEAKSAKDSANMAHRRIDDILQKD